jgi:hypothetical protein
VARIADMCSMTLRRFTSLFAFAATFAIAMSLAIAFA